MKSVFLRGSLLATAVVVACAMATPASAKARHAKAHQDMVPWHGWRVVSLCRRAVSWWQSPGAGDVLQQLGRWLPSDCILGDQGNGTYVKSPLGASDDQSNDDKPKRVFG
jgi:hypothetical protein